MNRGWDKPNCGVKAMNNRLVQSIAARMSLRPPQKDSLEILAELAGTLSLEKGSDTETALAQVQALYPSVTSFERDFPSLCFALATGVGKTRLMGAFITYLHLEKGMNNFFVLAPNLTIYNKLIADFTPNTRKYVFQGIGEFVHDAPNLITGDNYEQGSHLHGGSLFGGINVNVFNISKINSEVRGGSLPRIKRLAEYIGQSYFEYLSELPDLTLIMDESHRYRASAGVRVLNELKPVIGLELTATPQIETGNRAEPFKNIIYSYPLFRAMEDGFVKEPAVATRENFDPANYTESQLERLKLEDGIRVHEETKTELEVYARNNGLPIVKPFMLVVASDTDHANALVAAISGEDFFNGNYRGKVITVHSNLRGEEKDETVEQLMNVEKPGNPVEVVVHVNMLKEGWDVTNLYTIVPLRAANSRTLVEQSVGRGLRLPYGKRTGVDAVDRLTIIAHDRFQEIVDEARNADSIIRRGVVIGRDVAREQRRVVTINPAILDIISPPTPLPGPAGTPSLRRQEPSLFQPQEQATARVVYDIVQGMERLASSGYLAREEIRNEILVKTMATVTASPEQVLVEEPAVVAARESEIQSIVDRVIQVVIEKTIDIPKIVVLPKGNLTWGYHEFVLDVSGIQLQPVSEDLLLQFLRTSEQRKLRVGTGVLRVARPEDYLVFALMDYNDVSYDDHADLLYKLSAQVVGHLRSYLPDDQAVANVLQYNQQRLAELIHSQMKAHYYESATEYDVQVTKGFTTLHSSTVASEAESRDFRHQPPDLRNITSMVFSGFTKCLYLQQKFDSDAERRFAVICENDPAALKWFKPGKNQLPIYYRSDKSYEPDFVVETESEIFLAETKAANEMDDSVVLDKAKAAIQWCCHASTHALENGGKPWRYLLIPHDSVQENQTLQGLAARFTRR